MLSFEYTYNFKGLLNITRWPYCNLFRVYCFRCLKMLLSPWSKRFSYYSSKGKIIWNEWFK